MLRHIHGGFSIHIDIRRLERETRGLLRIGFLLGTAFLITLCLSVRGGITPAKMARGKVETRIVTDLVPVPPVPREPVKIPSPERKQPYLMRPSFRPVFPRISGYGRTAAIPDAVGDRIQADIERRAVDISERFHSSLNVDEGVSPAPTGTIPLPEYLVPDTGTSSAEVVIPPGQKRAIRAICVSPTRGTGGSTRRTRSARTISGSSRT